MKLYGTTTSPFVRRVRVVASEVGEPVDLINTASEAGQAALREVSAIRKVPVAIVDGGRTLFDSRAITDYLTVLHGWGTLAPPRDRWRESNLLNAVDGALESVIALFYLRRDGIAVDDTPFATRQLERADAIFAWLATQLESDQQSFAGAFGMAELSVCCALDWMDFRETYETQRAAGLTRLREAWAERATLVATRPHA